MYNRELRYERMRQARSKGTHTKEEWIELKELCNGTCVKCHGRSGLVNVEKDHIVPVYQGGSDSIRNIQPMCGRCNSAKGPESFDYRLSFLSSIGKSLPEKFQQHG